MVHISNIYILFKKNIYILSELCDKKKCLLIMNMATSHMHPKVFEYLNDNDIHYIIIPPGFTRYLQPMDIYVNKD